MSALRHYAFALPSRQLSTLEQICASERGVDRFETDGRIVHALLRKQLGVRAILNYAPISLNTPHNVKVQYIDPATHLQRMTYYL